MFSVFFTSKSVRSRQLGNLPNSWEYVDDYKETLSCVNISVNGKEAFFSFPCTYLRNLSFQAQQLGTGIRG